MRAIIILAAIAFTHGAKLENTYLPPTNARTAGGSGNFLQAPSGPSGSLGNYQNTAFSQGANNIPSGNSYSQDGNNFAPINSFSQPQNDYSQSSNGFAPIAAEYNNVNFNNYAQEARPERPRAALERNAAILRQDSSNDGETFSYAFETENGIYAEESGVATNGVEAQGGYSYTGDDGQVYSVRYTADQNGFVPQGDHLPTPPPVPEEILKALEQNARDEAAGIYDDGSYNEGKYSSADNNNFNQYNYQNNAYNGNNDDTIVTNSALTSSNNGPSFNTRANSAITPVYGAPNAPSFNTDQTVPSETPVFNNNAQTFNTRANNGQTFNTPANNGQTFNAASNFARNSVTEKAYLPPFADQRGQARNAFGRRQQTFDARTGYNY